jgi:DNA-binding MarR family transcriptional regulator
LALVVCLLIIGIADSLQAASGANEGESGGRAIILIHDINELQNMSLDLNGSYELANDIDASATRGWNGGAGFIPVGNESGWYATGSFEHWRYHGPNVFNGTLDGRGFNITGLYINSSTLPVGLFGWLGDSSIVENVTLEGVDVTGKWNIATELACGGCLAGFSNGTVRDCRCKGVVHEEVITEAGGLIGYNTGLVTDCGASGFVSSRSDAGGLVGLNDGVISNCFFKDIRISDNPQMGGLVGFNSGTITGCHAEGYFESDYWDAGGLVGGNSGTISNCSNSIDMINVRGSIAGANWLCGIISDCFNTGSIQDTNGFRGQESPDDGVGGLSGRNSGGIITRCFSTGPVNGFQATGGLVGCNDGGTILDCYAVGSAESARGTAGGLVGYFSKRIPTMPEDPRSLEAGNIKHCYSVGAVSGNTLIGGLVGVSKDGAGKVSGCYWDNRTSGTEESAGGTGKNTPEMMMKATFQDWDFTNVWDIRENASYPVLRGVDAKTQLINHMPETNADRMPWSGNSAARAGAATVLALGVIGTLLAAGTEPGKYGLSVLFLPLYTRLRRKDVMNNEKRGMIRGAIALEPGIHYSELIRRLDIPNGEVAYHLKTLECEGIIKSRADGRFRRFYPAGMKLSEVPVRLTRLQMAIFETLRERDGMSKSELSRLLEVPFTTLHRQVGRMTAMGVLKLERKGLSVRCYIAEVWKGVNLPGKGTGQALPAATDG